MEDKRIIELYWQRDESAIRETDIRYGAYCYAIANNILHSREDSEECVNDTWMQTWNTIPPKRPERLQLFLARITRNLSFNKYKAMAAKKRGSGEIALVLDELEECIAAASDTESTCLAAELGREISAFVRSLPEREGNLFIRRYFFTEPITVIAKHYALTENTVCVSLSRTRKKLRTHLEKEGYFI